MPSHDSPRQTPAEIARAALKRLAEQGIAPTPAHYRRAYLEESRAGSGATAGGVLARLSRLPLARSPVWPSLRSAIESEDWEQAIDLMAGASLEQPAAAEPATPRLGPVAARFVREWARSQAGVSHLQKLQALTDLDAAADAAAAVATMQTATERWARMRDRPAAPAAEEGAAARPPSDAWKRLWIDAVRVAQHAYADHPGITTQAEALLREAAELEVAGAGLAARAQGLWGACETWNELSVRTRTRLVDVFRLLLDNVAEAFPPEHWMQDQIAGVHAALAEPIDVSRLELTVSNLKDVLFRQGVLARAGDDARTVARELIDMVVRSLGAYVENSARYGDRLEAGMRELSGSEDWDKAKTVVQGILLQSQSMLEDTRRLRASFDDAQAKLAAAQTRARSLESELQQVSELVQIDPLTGALNRRGLESAYRREVARSSRANQPLAVAMIDLDHFKRINDSYGHDTGDEVLKELVRIAREHLRPSDTVARLGGEEFMLLLPGEDGQGAAQAVARMRAAFAARSFAHPRQPAGIRARFSAGIATAARDEPLESIYARADRALLDAKAAGRDRVEHADEPHSPDSARSSGTRHFS